jgi:prepilin-type N-terminal cleavage/methylation domain-containing protein
MEMRRQQKGFSLIELLIVVVIILIIAAMAIPNFMRARMTAYESSAVASIRTINTSAMTYLTTYAQGFPPSLAAMGDGGAVPCIPSSTSACLLDPALASGTKSGYTFIWTGDGAIPSIAYTLTATPISVGSTGQRMFCTDQASVINFDPTGAGCTNASTPLQ